MAVSTQIAANLIQTLVSTSRKYFSLLSKLQNKCVEKAHKASDPQMNKCCYHAEWNVSWCALVMQIIIICIYYFNKYFSNSFGFCEIAQIELCVPIYMWTIFFVFLFFLHESHRITMIRYFFSICKMCAFGRIVLDSIRSSYLKYLVVSKLNWCKMRKRCSNKLHSIQNNFNQLTGTLPI